MKSRKKVFLMLAILVIIVIRNWCKENYISESPAINTEINVTEPQNQEMACLDKNDICPDTGSHPTDLQIKVEINERKTDEKIALQTSSNQSSTQRHHGSFAFLGQKVGREENFDADVEVTTENILYLYRHYDVEKVEDTDLYMVSSKKVYEGARYLTRLIKFKDGIQTSAITFYDYHIPFILKRKDGYILGLNSLAYSSAHYPSSFGARVVILDKNLKNKYNRLYRYKDYCYTYLDTLYTTAKGFSGELVNIDFDPDECYRYKFACDSKGVMLSSSKKKEAVRP